MQKLALRTAQAEKQAAKRLKLKKKGMAGVEGQQILQVKGRLNIELRSQLRQSRRARVEQWTMGPLAPQRNHAAAAADFLRRGDTRLGQEMFASQEAPHWGSISVQRVRLNEGNPVRERVATRRCAWAGTPKRLCLAEGDRVIVMEGPFKGSIGPIKEIDTEHGTVTVEGVARTNITVPELLVEDAAQQVQQIESAIPIDAVRLVHPLTDPATGQTRDVVIRELRPTAFALDRVTRRLSFSRVVPGLNVRIPWPRPATAPPEPEDQAADTLRIDAEQVTFVPTLLRPPAPEAVLDELRNKYSRFRTRHTPEYIAAKEAEEAAKKEARKHDGAALVKGRQPGLPPPEMRTPLDEFHLQQKALRRARGQPELTDDMLEKIGRLMAQNRPQALGNAASPDLSQSPPSAPPPPSP